jgi:hypothetical protein
VETIVDRVAVLVGASSALSAMFAGIFGRTAATSTYSEAMSGRSVRS